MSGYTAAGGTLACSNCTLVELKQVFYDFYDIIVTGVLIVP